MVIGRPRTCDPPPAAPAAAFGETREVGASDCFRVGVGSAVIAESEAESEAESDVKPGRTDPARPNVFAT